MKSLSRFFLLFFICLYIETQSVFGSPTRKERISVRKCNQYKKLVEKEVPRHGGQMLDGKTFSTETNFLCVRVGGLVVGGAPAKSGEFPHMAAIGFDIRQRDGSYKVKFVCGGSLISERHVLTAAHCSEEDGAEGVVRLGALNINLDSGSDFVIEEFIKHEKYNRQTKQNDIAIIKLSRQVPLNLSPHRPDTANQLIRPACLSKENENYRFAIATGWGKTEYGARKASDVLMRVKLEIFDINQCDYLALNDDDIKIDDNQICAGVKSGGNDTCNGDSGGPIQFFYEPNTCVAHIIGVTSFGPIACGSKDSPAIYARVSSYLDWIEEKVWPGQ